MIIKKYKALTEKDAILLAKDDLGPDAIVMNVKKIKPGGIMRLFRKPSVELTAAIDDGVSEQAATVQKRREPEKTGEQVIDLKQERKIRSNRRNISCLEKRSEIRRKNIVKTRRMQLKRRSTALRSFLNSRCRHRRHQK